MRDIMPQARLNLPWVALERILFVLPKIGSALEIFLIRPLRANLNLPEDENVQRWRSAWVGQAIFSKMA